MFPTRYFPPRYFPGGFFAGTAAGIPEPEPEVAAGTDLLKSGLAWLTARLQSHASQPITYSRKYESVNLRATFGAKTIRTSDGEGGILIERADLDVLFPSAHLVIGGEETLPVRGDRVRIVVEGQGQIYEVTPYAGQP